MIKDPEVFLKHILESIDWIEKDVKEFSKEDFFQNVPIQDAVFRRLEIIGEAGYTTIKKTDLRDPKLETIWVVLD